MANLLALGLSMVVGGIGRREQTFNPVVARVNGTAMTLAVLSILIPSLSGLNRIGLPLEQEALLPFSGFVAWILLLVHGFTLVFLEYHRSLYTSPAQVDVVGESSAGKPRLLPWFIA